MGILDEEDVKGSSGETSEQNAEEMIRMVERMEEEVGGEFNQNEYFNALSTLKTAKLFARTQVSKDAVERKLAELEERYGRLGSY